MFTEQSCRVVNVERGISSELAVADSDVATSV